MLKLESIATDDVARHGATGENIRDAEPAWRDTSTFTLDLAAIAESFRSAGLDRSLRTLQRYCEQGHLRAAKYPSETGSVWIVDPASVATKIEEIAQIQDAMARHDAAGRQVSCTSLDRADIAVDIATVGDAQRPSFDDADRRTSENDADLAHDSERQSATADDSSRYLSIPDGLVEVLTQQLAEKDRQIERRDEQIKHLVSANAEDRDLLGAALGLIHADGFRPEIGGPEVLQEDQTIPTFESRPLSPNDDQDGDK